MFIHRVEEGSALHYGLNWLSNKMTLFSIKFAIPIFPIFPKHYKDFPFGDIYYGWRIKVFLVSFRIRRWKHFPLKTAKFTSHFRFTTWECSNKKLIATSEMIEDGFVITGY